MENNVKSKTKTARKLVLCFDGTGNSFTGEDADTNVVKIYQMCDRSVKGQFHYYQPGIGTYTTNSKDSVNESPFGKIKSWFTRLIDQGFGTSLDSHVIAGYRFLMRYYTVGDEIYMFGFSRGAFTARFLASMIYHVGILSKGNEEMIPFAYKTYQDHELGGARSDPMKEDRLMKEFRETFCLGKVQVHFLGLFDTVRSVGTFDAGGAKIPVSRTFAKFTRHAVALDERRSKFKAALLCQNTSGTHTAHVTPENPSQLDIYTRERWFPGNHGDVGGGWPREENALALSDIALGWMLREIQELPAEQCIAGPLNLNMEKVTKFETQLSNRKEDALLSKEHDVLRFGRGVSWFKVIMWNILEYSPFSSRLELNKNHEWVSERWRPNCGGRRDLPLCAVLDSAIIDRKRLMPTYTPDNDNLKELLKEPQR